MDDRPELSVADLRAILSLFERLAVEAGQAILEVRGDCDVAHKRDGSPVTIADEAAEVIILKGLAEALPDIPVVSEEAAAAGYRCDISAGRFILVDPLDGTKEFIKGSDEFTVNIALIDKGAPVAGVVHAPAQHLLWSGGPDGATVVATGAGGEAKDIAVSSLAPANIVRIVASASHRTPETDAFIALYPGSTTVSVGSSLKFCLLAEGKADLYPRFGRTMEWDTAAGDAVLRAAGGATVTVDGLPFAYGKTTQASDVDFANGSFVATADLALIKP